MNKDLYLHTLRQLLDGCIDENLETERDSLEWAIQMLSADGDAISKKAVEYICSKETVSTNPYNHKHSEKFIQFLDDEEIADFGKWQWENGFNTALVAVKCELDKLPSIQPEKICVANITLTQEQVEEAFKKAKTAILAVQAEQPEIIFCNECIHWNKRSPKCNKTGKLGYGANDFCSKGERK